MSRDIRWITGSTRLRTAALVGAALVALGARLAGQELPFVMMIQDDSCPLRVVDARREIHHQSLDLVVVATISNPTRRAARGLIVTAALIDAAGRVTSLQMEPIDVSVSPSTDRPFRIVFRGFTPSRGERVAFGIQVVRWSKTDEWRGALKVVTAPALLASGGGTVR